MDIVLYIIFGIASSALVACACIEIAVGPISEIEIRKDEVSARRWRVRTVLSALTFPVLLYVLAIGILGGAKGEFLSWFSNIGPFQAIMWAIAASCVVAWLRMVRQAIDPRLSNRVAVFVYRRNPNKCGACGSIIGRRESKMCRECGWNFPGTE